jgi:hypothetical protein
MKSDGLHMSPDGHKMSHKMAMEGNASDMGHHMKSASMSSMYDAEISHHFKSEMMDIAYGKHGKKGYDEDAKHIAPHMQYNDNADQNGY